MQKPNQQWNMQADTHLMKALLYDLLAIVKSAHELVSIIIWKDTLINVYNILSQEVVFIIPVCNKNTCTIDFWHYTW